MGDGSIGDHEALGRACFDSDQAGRRKPRTRFIERSFVGGECSVDLLDRADHHRLASLHDHEGAVRVPPRTFHGWYVFSADAVRSVGWDAWPDPTLENPWHAEVRKGQIGDADDANRQNCEKVAALSLWRDRPMSREDEEFLDNLLGG